MVRYGTANLWFLVGDSFLVLFFSLLPIPLSLANWTDEIIWGFCNALLGSYFFIADFIALRAERKDREKHQQVFIPIVTPMLFGFAAGAIGMGVALWLSALDVVVPRGQAVYVLGLITLLVFGAFEFSFFIGLASRQNSKDS